MKDDILKYDQGFTESNFKSYVDNVFIQIHLAVMNQELLKVSHFMSSEVEQLFQKKVDDLISRGRIQMYDEINVKSTEIIDMYENEDDIFIVVRLISRYMDYLLDADRNFISGDDSVRIQRENILTFSKKKNAQNLDYVRKCPGCGVSIDVNANGLCAYCGTVFDLVNRDWILVKFEVK